MDTKHKECHYYHCDLCGNQFMTVGSTVIGLGHPIRNVYLSPKKPGTSYICPHHRKSLT